MRSTPAFIVAAILETASAGAAEPLVRAEAPAPSYWSEGAARPFVSARVEGGLYVKPQVAIGYGKPHWEWVGVEVYPMTTWSFAAAYAGVRGTLPFLDLRVGARDTYSYNRSFLPVKGSYDSDDVTGPQGGRNRAHYATAEAELTLTLPLPARAGYVGASCAAYAVLDAPRGTMLYEESLRAVMRAPSIVGNRLGYVLGLGHDDFIKVGVLGELIVIPGRSERVWRAGPLGTIRVTDHLDANAALSLVVSSPDALGILDGPFGVLNLVYVFATGETRPHFP